MTGEPLTYRGAGVDVAAAGRLVEQIAALARSTHGPDADPGPGAFAGLYRLPGGTTLAATCDGVGTKLLVAREANSYEGIGRANSYGTWSNVWIWEALVDPSLGA